MQANVPLPSNSYANRSGFTLIELSIVLVIIGLIVGGVLVGKDLIIASELNSVISDTNKYKIAVGLFKERYNALPGDMTNASTHWPDCDTPATNCNGNGDFEIYNAFHTESFRAWQQLAADKFIEGSYTGTVESTDQHVIGVNVPASKISGLGYQISYMGGSGWLEYPRIGNYINIGSIADKRIVGGAFTPAEAKNIDTKMDDGSARGGLVRAVYGVGYETTRCTNGSWETNPGEYNLSSTETACVMFFWLD